MDKPLSFVTTSSLHLAALLGTLGAKHLKKTYGPDKTPQGQPKVRWVFESDSLTDEIAALWQKPINKVQWDGLTREQRDCVISVVSAFADNLKHYIAHTKEKG